MMDLNRANNDLQIHKKYKMSERKMSLKNLKNNLIQFT